MLPWLAFLLVLAGDAPAFADPLWAVAGLAALAIVAGGAFAVRGRRPRKEPGRAARRDDVLDLAAEAERPREGPAVSTAPEVEAEPETPLEETVEAPARPVIKPLVLPEPRLPTVDLALHTPDMGEASPRLAGLVQRLSEPDFEGGWHGGMVEPLDIVAVLEQVITELLPYAEDRGVGLEPYGEDITPEVWADWDALAHGILEILLNAVDFAPEGSVVRVRLADLGLRAGVVVEDVGPEMGDEELSQVFSTAIAQERPDRPWGIDLGQGGRLEFRPGRVEGCAMRLAVPAFAPEREPHLQWL